MVYGDACGGGKDNGCYEIRVIVGLCRVADGFFGVDVSFGGGVDVVSGQRNCAFVFSGDFDGDTV